jgi:hypothetical protein
MGTTPEQPAHDNPAEHSGDKRRWAWVRAGLAIIGAMSIVALTIMWAWQYLPSVCETTTIQTVSTDDKKVKATVYRNECGAAAATRTLVSLSADNVDGTKGGEIVLILKRAENTEITWTDHRHLLVANSPGSEVEYAVAKTHGVVIELKSE